MSDEKYSIRCVIPDGAISNARIPDGALRYVGTLWGMPIFEDPNKHDPPGWWLIETLREGAD